MRLRVNLNKNNEEKSRLWTGSAAECFPRRWLYWAAAGL
jgi:hypothetical protein